MSKSIPYSNQENDILIRDLKDHSFRMEACNFVVAEELWEVLCGIKRTAYNLHCHTKKLAEALGHTVTVISKPKRKRKPKAPKPTVTTKKDLFSQLVLRCQNEIRICQRKTAELIKEYERELIAENESLRKEVRELRGYKEIVERNYRREACL